MKAVVWSRDNCAFCIQAKELLTVEGIDFEERKIGAEYTTEDLLREVPTARTVPQIFLDGKYVGGFSDLRRYLAG